MLARHLTAAAIVTVAFLVPPAATHVDGAARRAPNVIVILADDLGYGDLGVYGSKLVKTPHIDALAGDGVRFTQGYVTHPVCAPSRAALLTGRYQQRFGYEFNPVGRDRTGGVALSEVFIGQVMRSQGYRTGMVGKWHLGESAGYHPTERGFDEFFGITGGATAFLTEMNAGDESHTPRGTEGSYRTTAEDPLGPGSTEAQSMAFLRQRAPIRRGKQVVEVKDYLTDAFSDEAVRFIGANKDRPFFLYVAHTAPHTPLQATKKYVDRYRNVPDKGQRVYAAMVSALDDGVGAIRAKLKAEGLERDTLIIFLSDNGCAGYVLGACTNAPLGGFKATHLEGGVRVPFIAAWPGRLPAGRVENRKVSSLDIAPTAAAVAGAKLPRGTDGVNLMPYLTGATKAEPNPTLFWRAGPTYAVREGRWKLWLADKADPDAPVTEAARPTPDGTPYLPPKLGQHAMLYDLSTDLAETRNVAAGNPQVVERLKAKLKTWDAGNVPPQWTSMRQSVRRHDGQALKLYD